MLLTMYCLPNGDVISTLPSLDKQAETYHTPISDGEISFHRRVGIIKALPQSLFAVEFIPAVLKKYNKTGFSSRVEAVSYEQNILNSLNISDLMIIYQET